MTGILARLYAPGRIYLIGSSAHNARRNEAAEWLRVAGDDLRLADVALTLDPPIIGLAVYHAQQTVEKALKAHGGVNWKLVRAVSSAG